MGLTTTARYRVLGYPHESTQLVLIACDETDEELQDSSVNADAHETDTDDNNMMIDEETSQHNANAVSIDKFEPVYIDISAHDTAIQSAVDTLAAGYLIEATLKWTADGPQIAAVDIIAETEFIFYEDITGIFEAATSTWNNAVAEGEGMGSRLTRGTDAKPNGALYVFAKQQGARNLIREFQTGITPLEPLIRRIDEEEAASVSVPPESTQPRAVFILEPATKSFVIVYVVFRRDGMLAGTLHSTYGEDANGGANNHDRSKTAPSGPLRFDQSK